MKRFYIAISIMVLSAAASLAKAQTSYMPIVGPWQIHSNQTSDGFPQCQMVTLLPNGAGLFSIGVSPIVGRFSLFLQKDGWEIPDKKEIPINISFEKHGGLNFIGYGYGEKIIIIPNPSQRLDFLLKMSESKSFIIQFVNGNEGLWFVSGAYSKRALNNFSTCVDEARKMPQPPTQPY